MPFKSKRQLQACYALRAQNKAGNWDCDKWLRETPDPNCLPTVVNGPKPKNCRKQGKIHNKGELKTGPRGGQYYEIYGIKVYVKK